MNAAQLDEILARLNLEKNHFRTLGLLPLLHVAWSDGKVQFAEASILRRFAQEKGWVGDDSEEVLNGWMAQAPSKEDIRDGTQAFGALARETRGLGASIPEESPAAIVLAAHEIMKASGGLFGLRSPICAAEESAMEEIIGWLNISPRLPWRELVGKYSEESVTEIPGSEGAFVLGKAREMLRDPLDLLVTTWQRFGDVSRLKLGPNVVYFIVHPDAVQHVLVNNTRNYVRDEVTFREVESLLGKGLITLDGEEWRQRRKLMQPAFLQQKLNAMTADMVAEVKVMLDRFGQAKAAGTPLDVAEETGHLALDVVNRCLLRTNVEDAAAFLDAMPHLLTTIAHRSRAVLRVPDAVPTPMNQRYRKAVQTVDRIVVDTIQARRKESEQGHDLLSMLMEAKDEETGKGLSDAELRNEVVTLMLAGHETTAVGLSWTLYLLSKYPGVRRQVRAEVSQVLGGREPVVSDLAKLTLTRAVIEEAMRLYPPAVMMFRKAVGEDKISGFTIPAGGTIWLSPYVTHRHPAFWPNPQGFEPERFLPEEAKKQHACAYFPFGAGPRKCIGYIFAIMEMQIALAMLLQRYTVDLVAGFEPELDVGFTLRSKDGMWMTVKAAD